MKIKRLLLFLVLIQMISAVSVGFADYQEDNTDFLPDEYKDDDLSLLSDSIYPDGIAQVPGSSDVSYETCDCDWYEREQCAGYVCSHIVDGLVYYGAESGDCRDFCCEVDTMDPVTIEPVRWRGGGCCPGYDCGNNCQYGGDYSEYHPSWTGAFTFFTNETSISDVTGEWETDLLGIISLKLTGDDIIRGTYSVSGYTGYIEGNYTANRSPMMEGIWWQEPDLSPPYQVGTIMMDINETHLSGAYSYLDGTWEPFFGEKVRMDIPEDTEKILFVMPPLNWTLSQNTTKQIEVTRLPDSNPYYAGFSEEEM
ncbi:MAG: hypothetical protein JXA44_07950 [Methanospirillaceae archaeon]|nr:hypothetical protein [Methanospirillaceae archaeon]